ncbi:contact-dependent growth inhibition system immunity protein [Streptomyces sp. NBC_00091]|uniref:contact-dependent growth inhibition system immunity protein n=1 Tax=Streptomyces sp. NBC_00091 TaxID=2975648 RepID=UPI00224E343F|nr:contact-dependent growth inhibition system immunity protein [Streptomyces sp. NBC_00091]MCX5376756.1 contact-dependent growth inhibition system immunity protein [Streptomyces sp. NBC_00091]
MSIDFDRSHSIEELEGERQPEPSVDSTSLVKAVHALRQRPLASLSPYELGRLVGQDVGLRWTISLALEILRETVEINNRGGFYDDDLLSAVLTRKTETWASFPELAREVNEITTLLKDLSPYTEGDVKRFLKASEGSL